MAFEIEAKMEVQDFDGVRSRLKESGADSSGSCLETNVILDSPAQDLYRGGKGLRVRTARDLASARTKQTVTYKGPRVHGR